VDWYIPVFRRNILFPSSSLNWVSSIWAGRLGLLVKWKFTGTTPAHINYLPERVIEWFVLRGVGPERRTGERLCSVRFHLILPSLQEDVGILRWIGHAQLFSDHLKFSIHKIILPLDLCLPQQLRRVVKWRRSRQVRGWYFQIDHGRFHLDFFTVHHSHNHCY
jgi:hypothetical protein